LLALAVLVAFLVAFRLFFAATHPGLPRVAHAGGSIDGAVYTDSVAAFDRAYSRGFRVLEVDFQTTSDGVLVCGHDWEAYGGIPPTSERYFSDRAQSAHPACTMDELYAWFAAHPDAALVSDPKDRPVEVNTRLFARLGPRLMAQAYSVDDLAQLTDAGVAPVILTLYRVAPFWREAVEIDRLARSGRKVLALTLPASDALGGLALWAKLRLGDTPVYAHSINACWLGDLLGALGVDSLYTDELPPTGC
jgi:glycerophosphoryl diester phosphodiesterase